MSLRRIGVLVGKELAHSSKNMVFFFALVVPLVLTVVVSLLFGSLFSEKPTLGLSDEGQSELVRLANGIDSLVVRKYATAAELRQAVGSGAVDIGLALPSGFDALVRQGETVTFQAFVWGESLLKNRAILGSTIAYLIRQVAGQEAPVEIVSTILGDGQAIPWEDRLLPFVVLMAIFFGGTLVPATSLVVEKQKRTLKALVITPTSLGEVLLAKALVGTVLSLLMGLMILAFNRAFGTEPLLLVAIMALGAAMAATFGVLLGALVKDVNTLFATVKAIGILLYAPALIYLFPEIPEWIGRLFPTYYVVGPIVEISQRGGSWPDVALDVLILVGLIAMLIAIVALVARRLSRREV